MWSSALSKKVVRRPGAAPPVHVKRYNDFRNLHARAEQRGLRHTVGPSLELPSAGRPTFAEFSSDPDVVAVRAVGLQRYLDLLACCGCPRASAQLRAFLELDDERDGAAGGRTDGRGGERKKAKTPRGEKRRARGGCGGCGLGAAAGDYLPSVF
jgi:hypothetical protein